MTLKSKTMYGVWVKIEDVVNTELYFISIFVVGIPNMINIETKYLKE